MKKIIVLFLLAFLTFLKVNATEYFVSKQGNDSNDGLSKEKAFVTIQKGIDVLKPGDTLTIGPGKYFGSVEKKNLGSADTETVIRAQIPGTVLIHGDVPAPKFEKVADYRFVYAAQFDKEPYAVLEIDTLRVMEKQLTLATVDLSPGTFYYDSVHKRLYISTTDMRPPETHYYTVSITPKNGLYLVNPKGLIVYGLAVTGFHNAESGWHKYYKWGIRLDNAFDCAILNCIAYLNSGGITLWNGGKGNVIDSCVVYGNNSKYQSEGGNIVRYGGNDDIIRNCRSFKTSRKGISFYGKGTGPVLLKNNLCWGNGLIDFRIKGHGKIGSARAENCIALGQGMVYDIHNCLVGANGYRMKNRHKKDAEMPLSNALLGTFEKTKYDEFADPDNLDFRLQSSAKLRKGGPAGSDIGPFPYKANIYFVKPSGDDQQTGTSVKLAWKTLGYALKNLKPGDTLYLEPGTYQTKSIKSIKGVSIRGRGLDSVIIKGKTILQNCEEIKIQRLNFTDKVVIEKGKDITYENCLFSLFTAEKTSSLRLTHCVFVKPVRFDACEGLYLSGNIYNEDLQFSSSNLYYSDYNSYPDSKDMTKMPDRYSWVIKPRLISKSGVPVVFNSTAFAGRGPNGTNIGIYHEFRKKPLRLAGPFIHSVSDTTANIEWRISLPAVCQITWGENPSCKNKETLKTGTFGTFSLSGLAPGKTYHFMIRSSEPVRNSCNLLPDVTGIKLSNSKISFKTLTTPPRPVTYYVAPDGNNANTGLDRKKAFSSINCAAIKVNVGDTVLIAGGVYKEAVTIRATGDKGKPITFKSLPGEKATISGADRSLPYAFNIIEKDYLNFDGLYFHGQGQGSPNGVFYMINCDYIRITRCFFSGKGKGYPCIGLMNAYKCSNLLLKNCVSMWYWEAINLDFCSDVRVENNVFFMNMIMHATIENLPGQTVIYANNILVDSQAFKRAVQSFCIARFDTFIDQNNCYFLRDPDEKSRMFLFYNYDQGVPLGPEFVNLKPPALHGRTGLKEYYTAIGKDNSSIFQDPKLRGLVNVDVSGVDKNGEPIFPPDRMLATDIDFDSFFATDPEVIKRGIGLQPKVFKSFHFNNKENKNNKKGAKKQ